MPSSSFLNINGDKKQNKIKLFFYLILNLFQNLYLSSFSRKFRYLKLRNKYIYFKFNNEHSISRKLCTLFWKNLNWKNIVKTIGKLKILELGPGTGKYFKNDVSIHERYIKKYSGYDIKSYPNWKKIKNKKYSFNKFDGKNFNKALNYNNNLIISQSCLEHVKFDLKFFDDVKKISIKKKQKKLLIHCLPSPFCLFTYLAHGYRQYNVENLNRISSVLGSNNVFVVKLGNLNLNFEHLKKTTFPLIFKKKNLMKMQNNSYYKFINKKILKNSNTSFFFSSFIVLVGFINFSKSEKEKLINNFYL